MDQLRSIQAFTRVVEAGSFSAAAVTLNTATSIISRRVADLEKHLGLKLLSRTTRKLSLTDAGQTYYDRSSRILADLAEAEQEISTREAELRGRIRLTAPQSFGLLHLQPALIEFSLKHPELQLDLDFNDRQVDIVQEGFDLALRIGSLADSTMIARAIAPIRHMICASPAYLEKNGTPGTPDDLLVHSGLIYSNISRTEYWKFINEKGLPYSVDVPTQLRSSNGQFLMAAATAGLGVVSLPTFFVHQALAKRELVQLLPEFERPISQMFAVYPPGRNQSHRIRVLVDFLIERFENPYWDMIDHTENKLD